MHSVFFFSFYIFKCGVVERGNVDGCVGAGGIRTRGGGGGGGKPPVSLLFR